MWYAALPELLVFFFGLLCLLSWVLWIEKGRTHIGPYLAAMAFFILALLSKESAVVIVLLLILASWTSRLPWRTTLLSALPFAALAVVYAVSIFAARGVHLHFRDGTFSLSSPVWIIWPNSASRLFWIWGVLSLAALLVLGAKQWTRLLSVGGIWIAVTLLPYSFLTYMPYVPSRHTYLASVGLAWVVAASFLALKARWSESKQWAIAGLAALILVHNCAYLWTKKQQQFVRRAAPTEALIEFARKSPGPIRVKCFPYGAEAALRAAEVGGEKPASMVIWDPSAPREGDDVFCDETRP